MELQLFIILLCNSFNYVMISVILLDHGILRERDPKIKKQIFPSKIPSYASRQLL